MHPISLNCRGISITCVYSRIGALVSHSYADEDWPRGEVAKGKIEAVDTDANRYKVNFFCDSMFGLQCNSKDFWEVVDGIAI